MLRERLITAAILIVVLASGLALDFAYPVMGVGGIWLLPVLLFFILGTASELTHLLQHAGKPVYPKWSIFGAFITAVSACVPWIWELAGQQYPTDCPVGRLGWIGIGAMTGVGIAFALEMRSYGSVAPGGIERIAMATLVTTYVGIPMGFLVAIRNLGTEANWGLAALVTFLAVTKSADTGAFFVGRAFGRNKMVPLLSPGKTWEGAAGGVAMAIAVSYLCLFFGFPLVCQHPLEVPFWGPPLLGASCALTGMFGDLAESYMKRVSGVKDSGGMLPGMGGVWDVTDSPIAAAVPGFLCFAMGVAGPVT